MKKSHEVCHATAYWNATFISREIRKAPKKFILDEMGSNKFRPIRLSSEVSPNLPGLSDFHYWLLVSGGFLILRRIVERFLLLKIANYLQVGVKLSKQSESYHKISWCNPSANSILENFYAENLRSGWKSIPPSQELSLCFQTNLTSKEVQCWFRRRRLIDAVKKKQTKFIESGWKFITYLGANIFAFYVVWGEEWPWDPEKCWENYPNQAVSDSLKWYYAYQGGMYLSFLLQNSSDARRKDYWAMLLHHLVTLSLLGSSWILNLARPGSLTAIVHDWADVFIEAGKMANYAKKEALSIGILFVFLVVWTLSRLYVHPMIIHWKFNWKVLEYAPGFVAYSMLSLMSVLICLNLYWTYLLLKLTRSAFNVKTDKFKDIRSSDEDSSILASDSEESGQKEN